LYIDFVLKKYYVFTKGDFVMKKIKKAVLCTALILSAGFVSAQQSNTNAATAGTFTTDVDNFMDVTGWHSVQTGKIFGYTGFSPNEIDLGLAKQFKKFYVGTYYNGNLWSSNSATKNDTSTNTADIFSSTTFNTGSVLVGIGNWGFKGNFYYTTNGDGKDYETSGTTTTNTDLMKYNLILRCDAGVILTTGNLIIKPRASLGYIVSADKTVTNTSSSLAGVSDTTKTTDDGYSVLQLGLGSALVLPEKKGIKQTADLQTDFNFYIYPSVHDSYDSGSSATDTKTTQSIAASDITLTPKYKIETKPADKLGINAVVTLPIIFNNKHSGDYTTTSLGTDTSVSQDSTDNTIYINPTISGGLQYAVVQDKFVVNTGLKVTPPSLKYNDNNNKIASSRTEKWNYGSFLTAVSFGFQYFFVKNIGVSTTMSIFNSSTYRTSLDTIWNSSMAFDLTLKL
jgi:hypothetical protein